ncbi:hypothetical protein B0G77_4305 [Paraburkholderia sp. BL10I2N1]|nr:hypothetical protein B0G77_4305 [Paraburkholderia sp. BL10I2N1]
MDITLLFIAVTAYDGRDEPLTLKSNWSRFVLALGF